MNGWWILLVWAVLKNYLFKCGVCWGRRVLEWWAGQWLQCFGFCRLEMQNCPRSVKVIEKFLMEIFVYVQSMYILSGNFWWSFCHHMRLIKQIWKFIFLCINRLKQKIWLFSFSFFWNDRGKWKGEKRTMLKPWSWSHVQEPWYKGLKKKESGRNLEIRFWTGLIFLWRLYHTSLMEISSWTPLNSSHSWGHQLHAGVNLKTLYLSLTVYFLLFAPGLLCLY